MLDSLAFDYLRREDARPVAQEKLEKMSQTEKLHFVGNRLIRRYGCFGCHIGIRDLYSPPVKTVENGVEKVVTASFDTAQPIGADLTGWGWKQPGFLDYGKLGPPALGPGGDRPLALRMGPRQAERHPPLRRHSGRESHRR
jgi:hypothetical protein